MQPIKFVKLKENIYNYDTMTLVNIISHKKELLYYFIVEYNKSKKNKSITKDLIEIPEAEYHNEIYLNYKIV
jgi:hypothetical protein